VLDASLAFVPKKRAKPTNAVGIIGQVHACFGLVPKLERANAVAQESVLTVSPE